MILDSNADTTPTKRPSGLYWVKLRGNWTIAAWRRFYWLRSEEILLDRDMDEVGEFMLPLEAPAGSD